MATLELSGTTCKTVTDYTTGKQHRQLHPPWIEFYIRFDRDNTITVTTTAPISLLPAPSVLSEVRSLFRQQSCRKQQALTTPLFPTLRHCSLPSSQISSTHPFDSVVLYCFKASIFAPVSKKTVVTSLNDFRFLDWISVVTKALERLLSSHLLRTTKGNVN